MSSWGVHLQIPPWAGCMGGSPGTGAIGGCAAPSWTGGDQLDGQQCGGVAGKEPVAWGAGSVGHDRPQTVNPQLSQDLREEQGYPENMGPELGASFLTSGCVTQLPHL